MKTGNSVEFTFKSVEPALPLHVGHIRALAIKYPELAKKSHFFYFNAPDENREGDNFEYLFAQVKLSDLVQVVERHPESFRSVLITLSAQLKQYNIDLRLQLLSRYLQDPQERIAMGLAKAMNIPAQEIEGVKGSVEKTQELLFSHLEREIKVLEAAIVFFTQFMLRISSSSIPFAHRELIIEMFQSISDDFALSRDAIREWKKMATNEEKLAKLKVFVDKTTSLIHKSGSLHFTLAA